MGATPFVPLPVRLFSYSKDFEGTMIFVSHDRMLLRGRGSRVLELGGESGTDRHPTVYPGSYVQKLGHEAPEN
jgi:ATPase subunit of ABC transporter with duplicated ATPase domains